MQTQISLQDKYQKHSGQIYLSGIQALVRLTLMLRQFDQQNGLNTAGFISGYRGSPLAAIDLELWRAKEYLKQNEIIFKEGLNEDLAVTSVWGTQQVDLFEGQKYDGVFGLWYGKGPGVDRSGDALKHANYAGTSPNGGVLVLAGDDHIAESSTIPHQSEHLLMACDIPIINPADIQDLLDFGIYGIALSRFSGCWIGMKTISENVNASSTVFARELNHKIILPQDFIAPDSGLHIQWPDKPVQQETRMRYKHEAAKAFVKANELDQIIWQSKKKRVAIVTTGKAYLDTMQALSEMQIDEVKANKLGISLYKVFMSWPLETSRLEEFLAGHDEVIVIEEKRPIIEDQIKSHLYHLKRSLRIVGKTDENSQEILPWEGELTPNMIINLLKSRFEKNKIKDFIFEPLPKIIDEYSTDKIRTPYYCSGCPHNTSTVVPEGSQALGGIGCHIMAAWLMPERNTMTVTHMGAEGSNWIGMEPFLDKEHIFANLGDGTYSHSGLLAIRAAVCAKANMTYKILYNDAVAMTGGQPVEGQLTVSDITRQLLSENVKQVYIVSDQIKNYKKSDYPAGVQFAPREDLDFVQKTLREVKGVTAIIYEQTCAAEKRRRRKRKLMVDPPKRAFINELVCEGCGDCSQKSNCISVFPKETEFGRKREIDQSSCNKDFSCVNGFCPSFVTVHGGELKKNPVQNIQIEASELTEPDHKTGPSRILITGIGGTGVVTISALLGMAAHIEGKASTCLDMAGLAQKGGLVISHVQIADTKTELQAVRIDEAKADILLGCDPMNAIHPEIMKCVYPQKTNAILNDHHTITGEFTKNPDYDFHANAISQTIKDIVGEDQCYFINATKICENLFQNTIMANLFLMGIAFQKGNIPLQAESIEAAIKLNKVSIDQNILAFRWGRLAVQKPDSIKEYQQADQIDFAEQTLEEMISKREAFLTDYQNASYAKKYTDLMNKVIEVEKSINGEDKLSKAVAKYAFKLMAYKDEYEVARLYTDGSFEKRIKEIFDGDYKLHFHLAPPLLAKKDKSTGHLRKSEYGPWVFKAFKLLAKMKILRGTIFDPFGYTEERKQERQIILNYFDGIEHRLNNLSEDTYSEAIEFANLPEKIKGFGHIKDMSPLL